MAEPITLPDRLGAPCWTDANLEATVRTVAAMGAESTSRFLATHSPMSHIRLGNTDKTTTDAKVFEQIARLSARENVVLVQGAPGTGKSHLINWLKLRYDFSRDTGAISDVVPVLVRRRTGSLKDALEQLVEQLPERFHKYLEPVRAAIDRISEREARKRLASELHLELGVRWEEAGKPKLPRTLRHLPEIFHAEGFGAWLCRDGGVIDRNVQRLISPSEQRDRQSIPQFTADEFRISDVRQQSAGLNTENVRNLIDEFAEEESAAEEAARLCNERLRSALQELTGLGNAALSTILRSIRKDLRLEGQRLVLLVEDVSTLSVLDDEVVNAVEPQDDATLCDLTAVLGMTEQAFQRLRDNQYQRIAGSGLVLTFPKDAAAASWGSDPVETDRFIARYLNATRLAEPDIVAIAEHRRPGKDVNVSACDGCRLRDACHETFGSVVFDETVVGLFPFRPSTAPYLFGNLDSEQIGVQQTQRGLLDHVVKPVMRHVTSLADGEHAPLNLPVQRQTLSDWQAFLETYLGGWPSPEQSRLRWFAEAWTDKRLAPEIASDLQPLLKPLRFQDFTAKTSKAPPVGTGTGYDRVGEQEPVSPPPSPPAPPAADAATQKRLADLLQRIEKWRGGDPFDRPGDHQEMVLELLKGALPQEDVRSSAVPGQRLLRDANKGAVLFEGAASKSAIGGVGFNFARSQDNHDLLVALTYQTIVGRKTWNFDGAERYKRIVARWLRNHQDAMLSALEPEGLSTQAPVERATHFLCMAAMIEHRGRLPSDTALVLERLTSTDMRTAPVALTADLRKLYGDLPERKRLLQTFLVQETSVPQGTGGINVIDPQIIIAAISSARSNLSIAPLPPEYQSRYWKSRYQSLDGLRAWGALSGAIADERAAIAGLVSLVDQSIARYGFAPGGDYAGLVDFLRDVGLLVDLLKSDFRWPNDRLGFFKTEKVGDRSSAFATVLAGAAAAAASEDDADVLVFDPKPLLTVKEIIDRCCQIVEDAKAEAETSLAHLRDDQDPEELERQILQQLSRVAGEAQEVPA